MRFLLWLESFLHRRIECSNPYTPVRVRVSWLCPRYHSFRSTVVAETHETILSLYRRAQSLGCNTRHHVRRDAV